MAQLLRALTALPEVLSSISSNHMVAHKHLYWGADVLLWCVWRQWQCTHIHEINQSILKKEEAEKQKQNPPKNWEDTVAHTSHLNIVDWGRKIEIWGQPELYNILS